MQRDRIKSVTPADVMVGKKIRARRLAIGMSQTELGEKVGVTFQQIQKYENGINRVGAGRLDQISRVLDVPVSYFFADALDHGAMSKDLDFVATSYGARISRAFPRIKSTELQRQLVGLIEAVAG